MKKWLIGLLVITVLVGGFFAISKPASDTASTSGTTSASVPTSFSAVQTAVASGGQLLDVRTSEEYTAGHIQNAKNFSLQDMQAGKLPSGPKTQALFVYCHSGNRSSQAAAILKQVGFTNVTDLGAISHVEQIGGKLVTGN